jgi:hypothetical protein
MVMASLELVSFHPSQRITRHKKQSPEGSRLRGFYFRPHPLMIGERGGENTSVKWTTHHGAGDIVFDRQDSEGGSRDGKAEGAAN